MTLEERAIKKAETKARQLQKKTDAKLAVLERRKLRFQKRIDDKNEKLRIKEEKKATATARYREYQKMRYRNSTEFKGKWTNDVSPEERNQLRLIKKMNKRKAIMDNHESTFQSLVRDYNIGYRVIPENPDYYCLEDGRIWSCRKGFFLKTANHHLGYLFIGKFVINGKKKLCLLHQVVAHTFLPSDNLDKIEINHKDGNKQNCHVSNLEWCTRKENINHAWDMGLMENTRNAFKGNQGVLHHAAKLTEEDVREIRQLLLHTNLTCGDIGAIHGVKSATIHNIKINRTWSHLLAA